MALIQCSFFSETLFLTTTMNVIIPRLTSAEREKFGNKPNFQTLFLLHGFSDNHSAWVRRSCIERYAEGKRLAVVMPEADQSFYTDMKNGNRYWTFISEEVPKIARSMFPLSEKREDNFVAGLSMGGYGALKMALRKPEFFSGAASLSGVVDVVGVINDKTTPDGIDTEPIFNNIFGDCKSIKGSENDLFYLAEKLKESGNTLPEIYQCCGTEDFLYKYNVKFRDFLKKINFDSTYSEGPGAHTWDYWDKNIKKVLEWLPLKKQPV